MQTVNRGENISRVSIMTYDSIIEPLIPNILYQIKQLFQALKDFYVQRIS